MSTPAQSAIVTTPAPIRTLAIVYARVFGPKRTRTPEGHPCLFTSGIFDYSKETPEQVAVRAIGKKWHNIDTKETDWKVVFDEDVIQRGYPHPEIAYDRVFVLELISDEPVYAELGIKKEDVVNHLRESWYLTKKWQTAATTTETK